MPPKERFTRTTIIEAAYQLFLESGMNAITTRAIARAIGGSTQPIFSQFGNIEEVHAAVLDKAVFSFCERNRSDFNAEHALLLIAKDLIETVIESPHLILSIPMNTVVQSCKPYLEGRQKLIQHLIEVHHLTEENAYMLFLSVFSEAVGMVFFTNKTQLPARDLPCRCIEQIYFSLLKNLQP